MGGRMPYVCLFMSLKIEHGIITLECKRRG